jgi:hypothetical protein
MLGVEPGIAPMNDYVDSFNLWSPALVRELCKRIQLVTHTSWETAFAANLHVSEFILYGVFVDEAVGPQARVYPVNRMGCHNYWDEEPLGAQAALAFADTLGDDDVAMMISAKSGTELSVRREALTRAREVARK